MEMEVKGPLLVTWTKVKLPIKGESLSQSPWFRFQDENWNIKFGRSVKGNICLYLHPECSVSVSLPFSISVQVENVSGKYLPTLTDWKKDVGTSGGCIWWRSTEDVERSCKEFRSDPRLSFRVTIEDSQTNENSRRDAVVQTSPCSNSSLRPKVHSETSATDPCLVSLTEDFAKLLDQHESFPDAELYCEGHKTWAHKNVLCVRSPVLAKTFSSDHMIEGRTEVVNIQNMDVDTFKRFLRYLYTGSLDDTLSFDAVMSLYEAGHMYGVESLSRRCAHFLIRNLMVINACDALAVANKHGDTEFVEAAIVFILEKKVPKCGDSWRAFCKSHPILATDVLNRYFEITEGLDA